MLLAPPSLGVIDLPYTLNRKLVIVVPLCPLPPHIWLLAWYQLLYLLVVRNQLPLFHCRTCPMYFPWCRSTEPHTGCRSGPGVATPDRWSWQFLGYQSSRKTFKINENDWYQNRKIRFLLSKSQPSLSNQIFLPKDTLNSLIQFCIRSSVNDAILL